MNKEEEEEDKKNKNKNKKDKKNNIAKRKNGNKYVSINNHLKCKWFKFFNQQTWINCIDQKTIPLYMLSRGDSPPNKSYTQIKKEWKKIFHANGKYLSGKTDF